MGRKGIARRLLIPELNHDCEQVRIYLMQRGIDEDIIDECIHKQFVAESAGGHDALFFGFDEIGIARYAMCRSTTGDFKGDLKGSDKSFSFRLTSPGNTKLHVFESAIDLLSFATLQKMHGQDWHEADMLSLAGVYVPSGNRAKLPRRLIGTSISIRIQARL